MSSNMIYKMLNFKLLTLMLLLTSCGSAKIVPTTDVCSMKKHWKEHIYQVRINKKKINKHWYLEEDARDVMKALANDNKCMSH